MSKQPKPKTKESYYDFVAWKEALSHLDVVNILLTEFDRKRHGMVKRISGTVLFKFEQPLGTEILTQSTLIDVTWKHTGLCYEGTARRPEYDVDKYLNV